MARLPYRATLCASTQAYLDHVHGWCMRTWPYTHGATWYRGMVVQGEPIRGAHGMGRARYRCTWSFQFKEDQAMFRLAWHELLQEMTDA